MNHGLIKKGKTYNGSGKLRQRKPGIDKLWSPCLIFASIINTHSINLTSDSVPTGRNAEKMEG